MPYIKFADLDVPEKLSKVPQVSGIYKVLKPDYMKDVQFQDAQFKNHIHNVSSNVAKAKYDSTQNTDVLYIGKAENLNRRLSQYVRFGLNKCTVHKGGRFVFAIKNWGELKIQYITCDSPREREKQELESFKNKNGTLPFANHRS